MTPIPRFQSAVTWRQVGAALIDCFWSPSEAAVTALEAEVVTRLKSKFAVAVPSVRYALVETVKALNLPRESEILCTPLTLFGVIAAIQKTGVKPVFVDLQAGSVNVDLVDAKRKITARTRVFLLTHLWGLASNADEVEQFAKEANLVHLEDASQCFNGSINGRRVGTFGQVGVFSFGPTKTVCGLGGAVLVTNDPGLSAQLRTRATKLPKRSRVLLLKSVLVEMLLKVLSVRASYLLLSPVISAIHRLGLKDHWQGVVQKGFPATRFSSVQARCALRSLSAVSALDESRVRVSSILDTACPSSMGLGARALGNRWMYAIRAAERKEFRRELWQKWRVDSAVPSINACHEMAGQSDACPNASRLFEEMLYVPNFAALRTAEVLRIGRAIRREKTVLSSIYGSSRAQLMASPRILVRGAIQLGNYIFAREKQAPLSAVAWELTYQCNCHCQFCNTWVLHEMKEKESVAVAERVAQRLVEGKVLVVTLSGGEPLLARSFSPVVRLLTQGGIQVSVATNGSCLEERAQELSEARVHSVSVSIDGAPETHDDIRGHPHLSEKIEKGIEKLRVLSRGRIIIRVRAVVTPQNMHEIVALVSRWRGVVDEVSIQPMQDMGSSDIHHPQNASLGFVPRHRAEFEEVMQELAGRFKEFRHPYYTQMARFLFDPEGVKNSFYCLIPSFGLKVLPNGDAVSCASAKVLGNLTRVSVSDVWLSPAMQELRRQSRNKCRSCLCWTQPMSINWAIPQWAILPVSQMTTSSEWR